MIITDFLRARAISHYSRERVLAIRDKRLRKTLLHAFDNSAFYRDLWSKAGINRDTLKTIAIEKLPLVTKKQLMGAFNSVVTDSRVLRDEVEKFIQTESDGTKLFKDKYIALNTSGSSGFIGLFLYTQKFWHRLIATVMARLLPLPLHYFLTGKVRIAFVGETYGHHAGVSLISSAPTFVVKTLSVSISMPPEELCKALTDFAPTVLVGYASALVACADEVKAGKLKLNPLIIVSSGEPLDTTRSKNIESAFGVRPIDFYGATECVGMGASISKEGLLDIFDDLIYVETVDADGRLVGPGVPGRVVITVFGNYVEPLVRYILDDEMVLESEGEHNFTQTETVRGRTLDRLVFQTPAGTVEVRPMDLVGYFLPGLIHYQIEQTGPRNITVRAVVEGDEDKMRETLSKSIESLVEELQLPKGALEIKIELVKDIPPNPKTGKTPLIIALKVPTANNAGGANVPLPTAGSAPAA